jgi:hypothetical protein
MKAREFAWMIVISLVFALIITLLKSFERFIYILVVIFAIILINVIAKKIMAFYLESEIEIKLWEIERYGFRPASHFKKPFPAGIAFPLVIAAITLGNIYWMASLVFDVKPKTYRAAKRHGLYSFSEMTERHIGLIATTGTIVSLICAGIAYLLGVPDFAKLSIIFVFFNMLPFSDLDGNKIFFGNLVLWSFLAIVTLIGLGYALLLI